MIIASKEAPLNPLDDAPEFKAQPDVDLIEGYLQHTNGHDISDDAVQCANDYSMLAAMLRLDSEQLDAMSKISLPIAVFAQTWRDQKLILLRASDVSNQDTEYARQQLLTPQQREEERNE